MARVLAGSLPAEAPRAPRLGHVAAAWLAAALALVVAMPENFRDPFASFDDYPILFDWWRLYFDKTLSEGRWVNFVWQYLVGPIDRHAAFYIVALGWAAICAILAAAVFRDDAAPWRAAILAVALTMSPPFAALTLWSNTLVPVILVLLAYTIIAAWAPVRVAVAALLIFAPLGIMSYTTSPMIMALALALGHDWRGLRAAGVLAALVVAGVALGVLVIHVLNWQVHGVFGIVTEAWRTAAEAGAAEAANHGDTADAVDAAGGRTGWTRLILLPFAAFLAAPLLAYAISPRPTLPLFAVLCCGFGFLIATNLTTHAGIPLRAVPFAWIAFMAFLALIARDGARRVAVAAALGALLVASVTGGVYWRYLNDRMTPFQELTADLAERVRQAGAPDGPILVYGPASAVDAIREVHIEDQPRDWSLAFRLYALTGRQTCLCDRPWERLAGLDYCVTEPTVALCEASRAEADGLVPAGETAAVAISAGGAVIVRFPD